MKCTGVYTKLELMNDKDYIENFLLINISQVLSGIKPASTVGLIKSKNNIYEKWIKYGADFIRSINLEFVELRENSDSVILLIYNREALVKNIFHKDIKSFMVKLGYDEKEDINLYIDKLKERYELYHCPHELGLFLGIPINDVKDFMNCTKKKCLLCGYWKVYNDCNEAKRIFSQYDKVKVHTVSEILKGSDPRNLALSIKNFFNA